MSKRKHNIDNLDYIADSKQAVLFDRAPFLHMSLYIFIALLIIGVIWASFARVDEITVADGIVVTSTHVQVIQSYEGGFIKSIEVHEGDLVKKGQLLIKLDDTQFKASYYQNLARYIALQAANVRLDAEAMGLKTLQYDQSFLKKYPKLVAREKKLFDADIGALFEKINILQTQLKLVEKELSIIDPLAQNKVLSQLELIKIQRTAEEIRGKIQEEKAVFRKQALTELNKNRDTMDSLEETLTGLKDKMIRADIVSPINGYVHDLKVNTIGGVIQPGMKILDIIPKTEQLLIEAKIDPSDIAFIHPGLNAVIKFSSYDFSIYGGLNAKISYISPYTIQNQEGEKQFYKVKLIADQNYIVFQKKQLPIIPGMTVNVDILTGKKSIMSYLLKPLLKTKQYAFRER